MAWSRGATVASSWTEGFPGPGIGAVGWLTGARVGASAIKPESGLALVSSDRRTSCSRPISSDRSAERPTSGISPR